MGAAKNTTSEEYWICEEVCKWTATIKGMPDDVGPYLVRIGVNGSILIDTQRYD